MLNPTTIDEHFDIEFRDNHYPCHRLERNGHVLYRVSFPTSYLYLTLATDREGVPFWTSVPEDFKLRGIVQELGAIIAGQSRYNSI